MKGMVVEMSSIFIEIVNNSITASYLIVAVIILRMILKKAPKWSVCLLWTLVAIRLALPFEIESSYSLVPKKLFQIEKSQNITAISMEQEETEERLDAYIQNRQESQQQNTNQQTEEPKQEPVQITMQNDRKEGNGIFSRMRRSTPTPANHKSESAHSSSGGKAKANGSSAADSGSLLLCQSS